MLEKKSHELVELKVDFHTLSKQQEQLVQARKDVESYSDLEKDARSVVPQDKDQARTVREIVKIAEKNDLFII